MEAAFTNYEAKDGYAILHLNRGKVNALNHQMVIEIRAAVAKAAADVSIHGIIISGKPNYFSAGLDIIELYEYDEAKMRAFFIDFGGMHIDLAQFPKPCICAITGHSPAGGTVIAITADHRIMAHDAHFKIGLNEVAVNIQISQNIIDAFAFWIGPGKAHQYIMDGKLLSPEEALNCNLVNELVQVEDVLPRAELKMQSYLKANPEIIVNTKAKLRKYWLDGLNENAIVDLEQSLKVWWSPLVRNKLKVFADKLAGRV